MLYSDDVQYSRLYPPVVLSLSFESKCPLLKNTSTLALVNKMAKQNNKMSSAKKTLKKKGRTRTARSRCQFLFWQPRPFNYFCISVNSLRLYFFHKKIHSPAPLRLLER